MDPPTSMSSCFQERISTCAQKFDARDFFLLSGNGLLERKETIAAFNH